MKATLIAWLILLVTLLAFARGIKQVNEAEFGDGAWIEFDPRGDILVVYPPGPGGLITENYPANRDFAYTATLPVAAIYTETLPILNPDNTGLIALQIPGPGGDQFTVQGYQLKGKKGMQPTDTFTYDVSLGKDPMYQHWLCDGYGTIQQVNTDGTTEAFLYDNKLKRKRDYVVDSASPFGMNFSDCGDFLTVDMGPVNGGPNRNVDVFKTGKKLKEQDMFPGQPFVFWAGEKDRVIQYSSQTPPPNPSSMQNVRDVKKGEQVAELRKGTYRSFGVNTKGRPSVAVVLSNNMFEMRSAKKQFGPFEIPDVPSNAVVQVVLHSGKRVVLLFRVSADYEMRAYNLNKKGLKQIGETVMGTNLVLAGTSEGDVYAVEQDGMQYKAKVFCSSLKSKGEVALGAYPHIKGKSIGEVLIGDGKVCVHQWK
jgi:hypothetical protein